MTHQTSTVTLPATTRDYLSHPSLATLWDAVRKKLEGNGLQVNGVVTLALDDVGVDGLAGLLGRRVTQPVRVSLTDLDAALRCSAAAAGLVAVTEALGGPLNDRKAARTAKDEARANTAAALDAALANAGVADQSWVPEYAEGVRLAGVLTKAGDGARTAIAHAGAAIAELAATGALTQPETDTPVSTDSGRGLAELATKCTGDAHGLDGGRVASALVLRAAAAALGLQPPESARDVRDLWTRLGVTPDEVSGTVLTWSVRPPGNDPWSVMMRSRADLGLVTHLTLHELRGPAGDVAWAEDGSLVSVCENPQVLQGAARAGSASVLLCTSGNPATAGWALLRDLVDQGVRVRYHGDFDWPGMAIAGRVLSAGAEPWRLGASDYAAAVTVANSTNRLALTGKSVATPWDPQLAAEMARTGVAVHEEAVVGLLLEDLGKPHEPA